MANLVEGYSCPICQVTVDGEYCQEHPDELMDLSLAQSYIQCQDPSGHWQLCRESDDGSIDLVCTMPSNTTLDLANAGRIAATLSACKEIPATALKHGYLQTLQQLVPLVSDHLAQKTPATEERLRKHLALIQFRSRSTPDDEHHYDEQQEADKDFDLVFTQEWHVLLWEQLAERLLANGFVQDHHLQFSKRLDNRRIGNIVFSEAYTKSSLRIRAYVGITHETIAGIMEELTGDSNIICLGRTCFRQKDPLSVTFSDDNEDDIDEFMLAVETHAEDFFRSHHDLTSICRGILRKEQGDSHVLPIALALLGNKEEALDCAQKWLKLWSEYEHNADFINKYESRFVPGLLAINPER